jgi:acetyl esterase/lipase
LKVRWLLLPLLTAALAAPAHASPYYMRAQAGVHPGIVMFLHGGGWVGLPDSRATDAMRSFIQPMGSRYKRVTVGYRTGHSLEDTLAAYDSIRHRWPRQPVCLVGVSAGAHLALMTAVRRRDVACVVDIVGPPDLDHLSTAPAAATLHQFAVDAFGRDNLGKVSPVSYTHRLRTTPVLVGASWCDIFIDLETQQRFADSIGARLVRLSSYHCIGAEQNDPAFMAHATRFTARHLQRAKRKVIKLIKG